MAECMFDNAEERPSLLEAELTCPVCKDLFRDPVLLSCSHSFCQNCLARSWEQKGVHECPVCRRRCDGEQPIPNRALKNTCESYQKEKGCWVSIPVDKLCGLHHKELVLYCMKDEETVCVDCVTLHRGHELNPLAQGAPICKEELEIKLNALEEKIEFFKRTECKYNATSEYIQTQAQLTEKLMKTEFEKLHRFLSEEEAHRIALLREEEEQKKQMMKERIASLNRDKAALAKLVLSVKREMGADDLSFLQNFRALKRRAQWTADDPPRVPGSLINVAQHLGRLSFKVWEKMQSQVTHIPVILDPNTASPWLSMSLDMTSVSASQERQTVPDNAERFDPCVFVLGSEGFTSGRHRWDVHVGDNPKWIVGVCKESLIRKRKFTMSTKSGVWTIGLSKGVYSALTVPRTQLPLEKLERVRVKLNYEKGTVSFWDPSSDKHICTFTEQLTERVFPIFGPGLHVTPMSIVPATITFNYA